MPPTSEDLTRESTEEDFVSGSGLLNRNVSYKSLVTLARDKYKQDSRGKVKIKTNIMGCQKILSFTFHTSDQ